MSASPTIGRTGDGLTARYEIRVDDVPGKDWSAWFDRLQAASDGTGTAISAVVPDQPALHGLLNRARDLGLGLISVQRAR